MRSILSATAALLALGVSAAPADLVERASAPPSYGSSCPTSNCMSAKTGHALAHAFADLIGKPFNKTLADIALAPDFSDYSDSVIELINSGCPDGKNNIPLGSPSFTSLSSFIAGQSSQAPISFNIIKIFPGLCNTVSMRWFANSTGTTAPEEIVTGNIIFETSPSKASAATQGKYDYQIKTVYSEFNSGAWLYNLGVFVPPQCPPPPPP